MEKNCCMILIVQISEPLVNSMVSEFVNDG